MKKIATKTVFFIILLLIFSYDGFCEDSVSINVSCTVPAIPGINAPLLETENQVAEPENPEYTLQNDQQSGKNEQPMPLIQEDDQTMLVKTFYPR